MTYSKYALLLSSALLVSFASPVVQAQTATKAQLVAANTPMSHSVKASDPINKLVPQAPTNNLRLDYSVLSEALNGTVIRLGLSARRHMSKPAPRVGSRLAAGHVTPYRLEGSRVSFSFFSEEFLEELTAYRQDLERIGTELDITHMPRNEQLAYWFNLHNVTVIEQISAQYPKKYPNRLKVNGVPIDEAKVLTVKGVAISTRDIREKIVFPHWDNPEVMYGFFRGDIGSPALQNFAYDGKNVYSTLSIQANEFVNALRGFNLTSKAREVSRLYQDVKPFYFQNWETDLKTHLLKYARPEVAEDIRTDRPWKIDRYDAVVADLVGGSHPRIATGNITSPGVSSNVLLPDEVVQLLRELDTKTNILRKRKLITRGTVTIEDVETIDIDVPPAKAN